MNGRYELESWIKSGITGAGWWKAGNMEVYLKIGISLFNEGRTLQETKDILSQLFNAAFNECK